jgi:predicted site-specific integrase-resolvase
MKLKEIKKKYGLSNEVINFYIKIGKIMKVKRKNTVYYTIAKDFDNLMLEKGTVYKYCFSDTWKDDLKDYINFKKYTSPVRKLSKKEIKEYEKELAERDKKE